MVYGIIKDRDSETVPSSVPMSRGVLNLSEYYGKIENMQGGAVKVDNGQNWVWEKGY